MRVSFFIPPVFLLMILLGSSPAWSTADGPDCWTVHGVAENDVLNIRSGPSPRHKVIGKIPADARPVANANDIECPDAWLPDMPPECGSGWCKVTYKSVTGWVNCRFLEESADCR